jgi:hypothetical protein
MEFISQEEPMDNKVLTNECIIIAFMKTLIETKIDNNEKWINIFSEFWPHIKDVPLDKENLSAWHQLGDIIEANLTQDWKDNKLEWSILERYIYNSNIIDYGFHHPANFEQYYLYFQQQSQQEYDRDNQPYYDSEEEREERLEIEIERGRDRDFNW